MASNVESYANLAQQLIASSKALDIALGIAAPIHHIALGYAYYVLGALAAVSILISTVRERLVADAGALRTAIVSLLIAAVFVGYRVDYHEAMGRSYEQIRQELIEHYQSKPTFFDSKYYNQHSASRYEMSGVIVYSHRFVTHFLDKFIGMANAMAGRRDDSGNVSLPMWAWEAWHSGIASDLSDTPVGALYADYIYLCSGAAMANSHVAPEEWRKVGLIGGVGFFEDGEVEIDAEATRLVSEAPWEGVGKNASSAYEVLRQTLPTGGTLASPKDGGYYVPSRAFWSAKQAGHDETLDYIDVPVERLKYQQGMIHPAPSRAMLGKAFYPVTCLDMYYTTALAFREMVNGTRSIYDDVMNSAAGKFLFGSPLLQGLQMTEDELTTMYRIALRRYKSNMSADLTAAMRSWSKFWDQFQLSLFVPMLIGTMALLYAFLVGLAPVVVAFSVIPGRSSTVTLYLHLFAYVGVVLFLEYFLLAMGTGLMASLSVTIGEAPDGYEAHIDMLAPFAIAIESGMVVGALGILYLAKLFVFPDKKTMAGALNTGMIGEPDKLRRASETATMAAATMVATRGMGALIKSRSPAPPQSDEAGNVGNATFRDVWASSQSSAVNPNARQLRRGIDIDGEFRRHAEASGNLSAPSRPKLPPPRQ